MNPSTSTAAAARFDPVARGYAIVYHPASVNHCPGCGHSNWHVGRFTAECAFCETALPLDHGARMTGWQVA